MELWLRVPTFVGCGLKRKQYSSRTTTLGFTLMFPDYRYGNDPTTQSSLYSFLIRAYNNHSLGTLGTLVQGKILAYLLQDMTICRLRPDFDPLRLHLSLYQSFHLGSNTRCACRDDIWRARQLGKNGWYLPEQFTAEWDYVNYEPYSEGFTNLGAGTGTAGLFSERSNIWAIGMVSARARWHSPSPCENQFDILIIQTGWLINLN